MRTCARRTAQLGGLVVAAFDGAVFLSSDPRGVSRLATLVVRHVLRHGRRGGRLPADRVAAFP